MKSLLLIASLTIPLVAGAANVVWDCLQIYDVGSAYNFSVKCNPCANFEVTESKNADGVTFTAVEWHYVEILNVWALANAGDEINREFFLSEGDHSYIHFNNISGCDFGLQGGSFTLKEGEHVYLGFAHANYYTPDDTMYGWAEVALDENGVLYAVNSMTDLTGASVIVGDIPEPSSALLLLLGAAALSLRRRHVNFARAV